MTVELAPLAAVKPGHARRGPGEGEGSGRASAIPGDGGAPHTRPHFQPLRPEELAEKMFQLLGTPPPVVLERQRSIPSPRVRPTQWVWQGFCSPARDDDAVFFHWVKAQGTKAAPESPRKRKKGPDTDHYFARFNKVIDVSEYTDREYDDLLRDPEWTKEETDLLFSLCRQYDLRFIVIADRFEPPPDRPNRSLEDLKDRYYHVLSSLLPARSGNRQDIVKRVQFDKAGEVERKRRVEALLSRSREQVDEEESILLELLRLQQHANRYERNRSALLHLLHNPDPKLQETLTIPATASSRAGSPVSSPSSGVGSEVLRNRKRLWQEVDDEQSFQTPLKKYRHNSTSSTGRSEEFAPFASSVRSSLDHTQSSFYDGTPGNISTPLQGDIHVPAERRMQHGAFLRSQKIPQPRGTLFPRIGAALMDYGMPRLEMATARTAVAFETLHHDLQRLVEVQRLAEKLEAEIQTWRERAEGLAAAAASPATDGHKKAGRKKSH